MRKFLSALLAVVLLSFVLSVNTRAEHNDAVVVIQFSDGSYITETIDDNGVRLTGSKSGSKTYDYYGNDGRLQWSADIFGNFVYTGATSSCTASNITVTIYDAAWSVITKSASRSGNSAIGQVTMGRYSLGVLVESKTVNLRLTCDANGNLS